MNLEKTIRTGIIPINNPDHKNTLSVFIVNTILFLALLVNITTAQSIQIVYTSDSHYGITRTFQGQTSVDAKVVHAALVAKMNNLPALTLPSDGGIKSGQPVGGIDYVINTGDIANREESPIQSASVSWEQFKTDYIDSLTLKNNAGQKSVLLLAPGNHDVSNAIGYYKTMSPLKDSSTMVNIYNLMMPSTRPAGNYDYANEKIHYSKNISGIHFMFVNIWPDSAERIWMDNDLKNVSTTTPVIIFTHDQPLVESKHFTNPNGTHDINKTDKFENLLLESFKDGKTTSPAAVIEQRAFASFVKSHSNIVAYFHGNDNANEFYTYTGPDSNITLNTFRVDSPMKGNFSSVDETKLSFQLISIDTTTMSMTVRECLWNSTPAIPAAPVIFGENKTVSLAPSTTSVGNTRSELPDRFELNQNYPNPFNPTTTISYSIPSNEKVSLKIFNLTGKEIAALVNEEKVAGTYKVTFDAGRLSSGVYFYKIIAGNYVSTKKLVLMK
ncbi:MAG: T9SS type A sorting domain-containing protein [Ignavibacteria bacterium]